MDKVLAAIMMGAPIKGTGAMVNLMGKEQKLMPKNKQLMLVSGKWEWPKDLARKP